MQREVDLGGRQPGDGALAVQLDDAVAHSYRRCERAPASFFAVIRREDSERAVADQLQHITAMSVHGRDHHLGVVVEQRNDLLRRGIVRDLGVAVQIAVPQHRADLLGDAAHDPAAHDPPSRIATEVRLRQRLRHTGERCRLEGKFEKGCEPLQRNDAVLPETIRRVAGPAGIDAIHLADDALGGETVDEHQIVGSALVTGLRNSRKIGRITRRQIAPHFGSTRLQQVKKRAALPAFCGLTFVGPTIIEYLDRLWDISAPPKSAAFVNRMQRVENDNAARQLNSSIDDPPAEAGHQLALRAANQTRLRHPAGKLVASRLVHIADSSSITPTGSLPPATHPDPSAFR